MYKGKTVLAIIPARGGSKRLPGKNIRNLLGKPLIAWSIEAAIHSNFFDEIMVNTDDQQIADISIEYGAMVPFLRHAGLSTDVASSLDVVKDTLDFYAKNNRCFDVVVLLQPTSPLRNSEDIIGAMELFSDKSASSVLSVCEVDHPIQWCNSLDSTLSMDSFISEGVKGVRSQDLEKHYRLNGAIYIWGVSVFSREPEAIVVPSYASVMPSERSVDIDSENDFIFAELLKSRQ